MLWRIRLRLVAPLGTPMVSGTLFGQLCWAFLDRHGEQALSAWLSAMERGERAPLLLSDAFPADFLPRPLVPPSPDGAARTRDGTTLKQLRRRTLVPRRRFLNLRHQPTSEADWLEAAAEAEPPPALQALHAHNVIDRIRNTTPETAGIWFVEDDWSFAYAPHRDVYVDSDLGREELHDLFSFVGEWGFGRDTTYGRGQFAVERVEEERELAMGPEGPEVRLVSLSHGALSSNMEDARYRRTTHFGKLAARMEAHTARPWKKPLLLLEPGATFRPRDGGPFGFLLDRVHIDLPDVRFNAWHLAVSYREATA